MKELFHINPDTGQIITKKEFDREEREVGKYNYKYNYKYKDKYNYKYNNKCNYNYNYNNNYNYK